jgi:hypothetical protein
VKIDEEVKDEQESNEKLDLAGGNPLAQDL